MSSARYVAVAGCENYFGLRIFKPGMFVRFEKEPDNDYDMEAIKVIVNPIGKVGYVANSVKTVPMGCQSAGRVYDTFDEYTLGLVRFVTDTVVIVELAQEITLEFGIEMEVSSEDTL